MSYDGDPKPGSSYDPRHRQAECRCGSGRKYKKCCALREHEELRLAREAERERQRNEPPRPMSKVTRTALMAAAMIGGGRR
jgi:hypothetical protein